LRQVPSITDAEEASLEADNGKLDGIAMQYR
jgi:hypothetical protein